MKTSFYARVTWIRPTIRVGAKRKIAAAAKFLGIILDFSKTVVLIYGFSEKPLKSIDQACTASWAPCFYMLQFIRNESFEYNVQ